MENFWEQRCHQPMDHRHENPAKTQNSPFLACQTDTDFFNDNSSSSTNNENASIAGSYPAGLSPATTRERFLRVGDYFSLAQWQELELQALIYKYMIAGASVPLELILPIKRSIMNSSYSHRHHQHSQTAMLQEVGYLGRSNDVDPEPGRCRRTDGKKWRCSREAETGRKYCDRHVHRSRARKQQQQQQHHLVESTPESPKATTTNVLNHRIDEVPGGTDGGQVQRQFFDDWPRSSASSQHQI